MAQPIVSDMAQLPARRACIPEGRPGFRRQNKIDQSVDSILANEFRSFSESSDRTRSMISFCLSAE